MFGLNRVSKRLYELQSTRITQKEARELVLEWYEPFTVYTRKLDGTRFVREVFTVSGPSGNVRYDYGAKGYMIIYSVPDFGFRTIVMKNIYKIEKDGETFIVQ